MINFQMSSTISQAHGVKMLVYGASGMGKTVLTATAPKPIAISAESGLLSLSKANLTRLFGANNQDITYEIPIIQIKTIQEFQEAKDWISANRKSGHFQTACIDSLSEIGEVMLANLKKSYKDPRQAYGELIEQMRSIIKEIRDMDGIHIYMSSKMEAQKNELTGGTKYGPSMPGSKLGQELPYLFDEVFRIGVANDQSGKPYRFLQTQPDILHDAKDRSGLLDIAEVPNLSSIIRKIQANT